MVAVRLYGKRFFAQRMEGRIEGRKESRDAVCWSVNADQRYAIVHVPGSAANVRAWFPQGVDQVPVWLKVGAPVRVAHVGGEKSRIELAGPGLVLPAPVSGSMIPTIAAGADSVLTGMRMTATTTPSMSVMIESGTYRIGTQIYSYSPGGALLGDGMLLGSGVPMGGGASVHAVDPIAGNPTEGQWFRYDAFVIGADRAVDYVKGAEWAYTGTPSSGVGPTNPGIPAGHAQIGAYILVYTGQTVIANADINRQYENPQPTEIRVVYAEGSNGIPWGGVNQIPASQSSALMSKAATTTVYDQYGYPYTWWRSGEVNEVEFNFTGTDEVTTSGTASFGVAGSIKGGEKKNISLGAGSSTSFTMTRPNEYVPVAYGQPGYPGYYQGLNADKSPAVMATLVSGNNRGVMNVAAFNFLNADGGSMPTV